MNCVRGRQEQRSQGIYGETGWLREMGILDHLEAVSTVQGHDGSDRQYLRFSGLTGEGAARILYLLPEGNLIGRQNGSPKVETLLELASSYPDAICVSGYLIMAPRYDERLSVDGLTISASPNTFSPVHYSGVCADDRNDISTRSDESMWENIRDVYGLGECSRPEEIQRIPLPSDVNEAKLAWWLWWD